MSGKRLVLATTNKGKIGELADLLKDSDLEVVGLDRFPELGEIEENGQTFEENALIKARTVAARTGCVALADDSGLCVDVLAGAPGIHSARYGADWDYLPGENRDQRNIRKLLHALRDIPEGRRNCRFVTAMAAVHPDGRELTCRGEWEGKLLKEPCGENGFGYDPIFLDPELERTAAQLSREEKNGRSHRGKALKAMLQKLPSLLDMENA